MNEERRIELEEKIQVLAVSSVNLGRRILGDKRLGLKSIKLIEETVLEMNEEITQIQEELDA